MEFHWIDQWDALEENGKPIGMSITLPDWLFEGIVQGGGVLTIHEDYFTLKGGIERWLYRVARKHAGSQEGGWRFTMKQLHEKSGSASKLANFACDIRKAVSADVLPEYTLEIARNRAGQEVVCMSRRVMTRVRLTRFIRCPCGQPVKGHGLSDAPTRFIRWGDTVHQMRKHGLSDVRIAVSLWLASVFRALNSLTKTL